MRYFQLPVTLLASAFAGAGCGSPEDNNQERHWAYEDSAETVGPESWGTLMGYETCSIGTQQTPVALATSGTLSATLTDLPNLVFTYQPSKLSLVNNGHTVQATYAAGSTMVMAGQDLKLAQFHFHAPSEHTLDGVRYPMEMHLVHVDAAGKPAAVVGVFLKAGAVNAGLLQAFNNLPKSKDQTSEPAGVTIDAAQLLPVSKVYLSYGGSLTTPPCTEGIRWSVMKDPIEVSQEQINSFTSLPELGHTNRPLQALNGRTVQIDATP